MKRSEEWAIRLTCLLIFFVSLFLGICIGWQAHADEIDLLGMEERVSALSGYPVPKVLPRIVHLSVWKLPARCCRSDFTQVSFNDNSGTLYMPASKEYPNVRTIYLAQSATDRQLAHEIASDQYFMATGDRSKENRERIGYQVEYNWD